jgi:hypothetical protein
MRHAVSSRSGQACGMSVPSDECRSFTLDPGHVHFMSCLCSLAIDVDQVAAKKLKIQLLHI